MNAERTEHAARSAPYQALVDGAGLVDLNQRTQIELLGADRASFLHNLCTNEIRKLAAGKGCEAFLTTVQGKTLSHGLIFAGPESLLFDTVSGQSETILSHLDHYLVCEQVTLVDRSSEWSELLLAGAQSESLLDRLTDLSALSGRLDNAQRTLAGKSVWLRRADLVGPLGFLISASNEDIPAVRAALSTRARWSAARRISRPRASSGDFPGLASIFRTRICRRKSGATRWPSASSRGVT